LLLANLTSAGTTLSSFNYTYNSVGNRTQVVEATGATVTWTYDPTYQLTNEQRSGTNSYNITYTYDGVGNRTLMLNSGAPTTYTYNAADELATSQTSAGVTTSTYDGSGNLLTSLAPGSQWTTNTWDGENRLTQVALPSGIVDTFTYDGDGQRVQKQDSTGTTNRVWDGQNILLETNTSNIIQVVYTLEPVLYGNLISQSRGGADSFYLFDALGTTRQLSSTAGSVTDSYLYDSLGNNLSASGSTTNWFRFVGRAGYELDSDLSAYTLRVRAYTPTTGRFISRDPSSYGGPLVGSSYDLYTYADNNPVRYVDPSGHFPIPIVVPPPNAPGCAGICVGGRNVSGVSCSFTKLVVPNHLWCKWINEKSLCEELKQSIEASNKVRPRGWLAPGCSGGCVCDPKGGKTVSGPQIIVFNNVTITVGIVLKCTVTISGLIVVTGGSVTLIPCVQKKPPPC